MARIVTKPFVLTLPDGGKMVFPVGAIVEDANADHWYVIAHSDEVERELPKRKRKADKGEAESVESDSKGEVHPETVETEVQASE